MVICKFLFLDDSLVDLSKLLEVFSQRPGRGRPEQAPNENLGDG